jgi:hypothetical protein
MADYSGFYGGHNVKDVGTFLQKYVAEIVFVRRRRAKDPSVTVKTRRMICTLNFPLLVANAKIFNFKKPTSAPPYNAASKQLVTVWDIIMQNWRNIDVKSAVIIAKSDVAGLPMYVNSKVDMAKFMDFYDKKIARMTVGDKRKFMDT